MRVLAFGFAMLSCGLLEGCGPDPLATKAGYGAQPQLPEPETSMIPTANFSVAVGWPADRAPQAPRGFSVTRFAEGLDHPRSIYVLPNGDVLVAEAATNPRPADGVLDWLRIQWSTGAGAIKPSANRITLLRDANADGVVDTRAAFLEGLNQPFGMALIGEHFYVANTDAILRFPYHEGETRIDEKGEAVLNLPAGGYNNHWTRNLKVSSDQTKLYVTVGSGSNIGEHGPEAEVRRANILEFSFDGSGERVFASGLRNPNGMDFEPTTGVLWTVVNERDLLGDDLVPDFFTRARAGDFYGWPYSYFGKNPDPRVEPQNPDLVAKAIVPDFALGAHTASLGLLFYRGDGFGEHYRGGAFISQHGSWNRSAFTGYKVIYVPFRDGMPQGAAEDFLSGFMADPESGDAYGRPVGLAVDRSGALLVADDTGNIIWRVARTNAAAPQ